jgi:hypothetical protein
MTTKVHLVFDGQGSMQLEWGVQEQDKDQGKGEGLPA